MTQVRLAATMLLGIFICEIFPVPAISIHSRDDDFDNDMVGDISVDESSSSQPCIDRRSEGGNGAEANATNVADGGFGGFAVNSIGCGAKGGTGGKATGVVALPGTGGHASVRHYPTLLSNEPNTDAEGLQPCQGRKAEGGSGGEAVAVNVANGLAVGSNGGAGLGLTGCQATGGDGGKAVGPHATGGDGGYAQVMVNVDFSLVDPSPCTDPAPTPIQSIKPNRPGSARKRLRLSQRQGRKVNRPPPCPFKEPKVGSVA